MTFITPEEIYTHLYEESVTAISGGYDQSLTEAIAAAISEIKGSLNRYDTDKMFNAVGTERNPLLVQWVKDIAVWHFINIANPSVDYEARKQRYERVCDLLRYTQRGEYTPDFPLKPVENNTGFRIGSNPKRTNHI